MNKIIASPVKIQVDQCNHPSNEVYKEFKTYLKTLDSLINSLFKTISNQNEFLSFLDTLIIHTQQELRHGVYPDLKEALEEHVARNSLNSLARVFLASSLARHNVSLTDLPLWKILLALKISLQGIRISKEVLLSLFGQSDQLVASCTETSEQSRLLRTSIIANQNTPSGRTPEEEKKDSEIWGACLTQLTVLDHLSSQILEKDKPDFDIKLQCLHARLNAHLCSVGCQGGLMEIRDQILGELKNPTWEQLSLSHANLYAQIQVHSTLHRIGVPQLDGGVNVHDVHAVLYSIATHRNVVAPQDPYQSAHLEMVKAAASQNCDYFDDPLSIAGLIFELGELPNTRYQLGGLANHLIEESQSKLSPILEAHKSEMVTRNRGPLADWAVKLCDTDPKQNISDFIRLLTSPATYMPANVLVLRASAKQGSLTIFKAVLENSSSLNDPIDWTQPIPCDPDQRYWLHIALMGGNKGILDSIVTAMNKSTDGKIILEALSNDTNYSLIHHAVVSPDGISLSFLINTLPFCISAQLQQRLDGYTPILRAAFCGNHHGVEALLNLYREQAIPSVLAQKSGLFGITEDWQNLLHLAAHSESKEILNTVLSDPAFMELSPADKREFILAETMGYLDPLHMAGAGGHYEILERLLQELLATEDTIQAKINQLASYLEYPFNLEALTLNLDQLTTFSLYRAVLSPRLFISLLTQLKQCKRLLFHHVDFTELTVSTIEKLPDLSHVQLMHLSAYQISPKVFLAFLAKTKVEKLDLSGVDLRDFTVEEIELLPSLSHVKSIDLKDAHIYPKVLLVFLAKTKVEKLDLSGVDLRDFTVEEIASLQGLSYVKSIDLTDARISLEVLVFLAKTKVEKWVLSGVDLRGLTVDDIASFPDLSHVKSINLNETGISLESQNALLARIKAN